MTDNKRYEKKVQITGKLVFETAFHIGSGKEGESVTDMGILKELDDRPILPGSTLKGNFRSFCERLAGYIGLKACLLDSTFSEVKCVSDENYRKTAYGEFKDELAKNNKHETESEKIHWLDENTCDVCKLFGSPMQASRIFFSDGVLLDWARGVQVRDGVCIDRDTETARYGAKYDFEVVPKGAVYSITIQLENPDDRDQALVAAALAEWEHGFRLGGFTSRGLGRVQLTDVKIEQIDYSDADQLRSYLMERKMTEADNLLKESLELYLT